MLELGIHRCIYGKNDKTETQGKVSVTARFKVFNAVTHTPVSTVTWQ